jgi:AcrR family transcriptional regulator
MEQTADRAEPLDTRQRILRGAAQVFAAQGYDGATTRAIAEAAGVNEVTLFRHFGSKKNLMQAVIERFSALPGLSAAFTERLTGDYREGLQAVGTHYLATMLQRRRAILMALCAAERMPEIREAVAARRLCSDRCSDST